jgi:TIR- and PNP-associating SLOG family
VTGRRLHIAGSANPRQADPDLLRWTHEVVRRVVRSHIRSGGTVLTQIGADPMHERDSEVRVLFEWTVLEAVLEAVRAGEVSRSHISTPLVQGVCLPSGRRAVSQANDVTLTALRQAAALDFVSLPERYLFGVMLRQSQERHGDILMVLGGGLGVEQLAELYMNSHKPVVPLDVAIGSYFEDSPQGGEWLASQARVDPTRYFRLAGAMSATAHLDGLQTRHSLPSVEVMSERVSALLGDLEPPRAFHVRLLDRASSDFDDVEWFFREVVDCVVAERGLQRMEVGTDPQRHGFINAQIFEELHYARVAVVDMTGQRPNCAIELGYALARGHTVVLSARAGERPPFDIDKLPFFFWSRDEDPVELQEQLNRYWDTQAGRPPVVTGT